MLAQDKIARIYLFVVTALLGSATVYVYMEYGLGFGAGILCSLTVLALWGVVSDDGRVRRFIANVFTG